MRPSLLLLLFLSSLPAAEPDFPLTEDSKPKPDVPKGELIKGSHTAKEGSVFPGTEREYQIYLPPSAGSGPGGAPFMVFQDGVIYQAPVVFDNLIAKREIPPLIGIFVKPGVVPAANDNALPRYNRSYEYDSVTDTYARFLIGELLPAIEQKHGLRLSTDPNDAAISGNSSGGIAAFMVAWHRPDRFRRVFTGVGTYVGIHGADQLPVLVRKVEPKPLKVFLQSGTGDNNLYCGDWWMANQMMERSLTWAGYDVNHAWGEGGHNQKHASQIFPDVLRWLWKGWPEAKEVKANPRGESRWKGYEVCVAGSGWEECWHGRITTRYLAANIKGEVFASGQVESAADEAVPFPQILRLSPEATPVVFTKFNELQPNIARGMAFGPDGFLYFCGGELHHVLVFDKQGAEVKKVLQWEKKELLEEGTGLFMPEAICIANSGAFYSWESYGNDVSWGRVLPAPAIQGKFNPSMELGWHGRAILSPDQAFIYTSSAKSRYVASWRVSPEGSVTGGQRYCHLDLPDNGDVKTGGLCVDTEGRLYVATALGIQVCDQAGRVNFIIPTPQQPHDVCFGGKDLGELFIACGDKIFKRPTKVHGIVSGQMPPIKPAPPKL